MKIKILTTITSIIVFLMPGALFAQAPALGTAANFVLFSTAGAVTNSGIPQLTHLTGNVGTNSGSSTGFGNVDGVMHDGDVASGACAADLLTAYTELNSAVPAFFPAPLLGNGDTLLPGVYHIPSAATLSLNLILNAQGNPNAVFIFQIQGSFSTSAASKIILINGGVACNVFWKVEGLVSMATGTTMRGTIVAHNAAINMGVDDTLEGRALSIAGAVTTNSILAYTPIGCGSPVLTGPAAPALVSAAAYGIFSGIGPVTNTGITYVVGDVGTNSGLTTGFDSLLVTGMIHPSPDASTAAAAGDLTNAYNYLNLLPADIDLLYPAIFGNDLVLTPHTYLLDAATMLTGNVLLNAENDANAVFIIRINGAFTTSTFSNIKLVNGAQAKNVYWLVNGAVHVYDNSVFNGTIVAAGAITLNTGDSLNGRALATTGAVAINGSDVSISTPTCVAPAITGTQQVCPGATTSLSDSSSGGTWSSSNSSVAIIGTSSGVAMGMLPGTSTITYTSPATCVSTTTLTVNPAPLPITGPDGVCVGDSITLNDLTTGGTWSSSDMSLATAGSGSGIVTGVAGGTPMITYAVPGSCNATKSIIVGADAGVITGPSRVCFGSTIILADSTAGGSWSASNTSAAVFNGIVIAGNAAGVDTIMYTVTNTCGTTTATKNITIDSTATVDSIAGPSSICAGSSIALTDATTGGIWNSSNLKAVVVNGMVTGVSPGADTISYTVINACGMALATKNVTVNPLPDEGSISGPLTVCTGSFIVLTESVTGGVWSSTNTATATVVGGVVTGVTAGIDTIRYAVTNGCGTATATQTIIVNPMANSGSITGPSSVCAGSSIALTDAAEGGIWSSSNTAATVVDGIVTGVFAGIDTIRYTVTNTCGPVTAVKMITVNALPVAGVITGPSSVCVGSSITLADVATGGVWSSANSTATVIDGMVTGVAAGADTIRYTVTNASCTAMATKNIIVNPMPDAGVITGASSVCAGSSITLVDLAEGGTWSSSNSKAIVVSGLVTGITAGADTISYTVATASCMAIATKTVTVNPLPSAGVITGTSGVCIGSSTTLADAVTGGTWSGSNARATVAAGVVTGVSAGVDTIRYAVTNGCGTATATKTVTVSVAPLAPVISTQPPSTACMGTMYQNFGAATMPAAGVIYTWTAVNATVWAQGTGHQYALVNFDESGTAVVTLTASVPGSACASASSVTVNVSTNVAQTPEVSFFGSHFVCTPSNEDTYQWGYDDASTLDSTLLTGQINQDYLNTSPDFYNKDYWVMTTSGGCLQKTYYHIPTAVQNVTSDVAGISVYPNPANTFINVAISATVQGSIAVEVWNVMGQKMNGTMAVDNKAVIDVATLPAGSYLITCFSDGVKIASARFVKN